MKKFLALLLITAMAATLLTGCGGSTSTTTAAGATTAAATTAAATTSATAATTTAATTPANTTGVSYKIGLSIDDLNTEFWMANVQAIRDRCKELGYQLVEVVANGDANKQNEQVSDLIAQGCQAIIICPNDGAAISSAVDECNAAGIPVIMNNRPCTGDAVPSVQVLSDNTTMAYDEMTWFIKYCKANNLTFDNAVMLIGNLSDENAVQRYDGFNKAIKENPGVVTVAVEINTEWDQSVALAGLQNALKSNADVDLIIMPSDFLWTPVQSALEEAGKWAKIGEKNSVPCISFDGDVNGMQMMYDGYDYADAAQAAVGTGIASVNWATYFINAGAKLDDINQLDPGIICTIENFKDVRESVWGWAGVKQ